MWQSSLYKNPFMALQVGNARGDVVVFRRYENLPHQFQHRNTIVGRKARPGLKNMSRHQTSSWQSSLCRNLFVDLQVENPRRDAIVSDHL
jgi:hypothetical protein